MPLDRIARRIPAGPWTPLALIGLTAFALAPTLGTGYWGEDTYYSTLIRGGPVLSGQSFWAALAGYERHNFEIGRFYPLTPFLIAAVFGLIGDVVAYKAYLIAVTALDLALFFALARRVVGVRGFAGFAACLAIGLFQLRVFCDPILAYYGQIQWMTAAVFASLLALQSFLEGRGRWWLAASALSYLAASLLYEVAYTLIALHLILIATSGRGWRGWIAPALPFFAAVGSCGAMSFAMRRIYPHALYLKAPRLDLREVSVALAKQTTAALPFSYYVADPVGVFARRDGLWAFADWVLEPGVIALGLAALALSYASLRSGRPLGDWRRVLGLGAVLAVFPGVLIAISPFHQGYLTFGVGWITLITQYFGVALLMAAGLWRLVEIAPGGGAFGRGKCLAAACVVAGLVGFTHRANREVAASFSASPGDPRYREIAGMHGASWHAPRVNVESALEAGLMDDVPGKSLLRLANNYPYWNDFAYGTFFYAKHTGKTFFLLPPTLPPAPDLAVYRVRDLFVDARSGFVVLSETPPSMTPGSERGLRLFVRHPDLGVSGMDLGITAKGGAVLAIGDLPVLRSGRGWALYSLAPTGDRLDPDSLRVVNASTGLAWVGYGERGAIAAGTGASARR